MSLDDYFTALEQFLTAHRVMVRLTMVLIATAISYGWEEEDTTFDNFLNDDHEQST